MNSNTVSAIVIAVEFALRAVCVYAILRVTLTLFIHAEGEATRTLLQQQENQRLRDELAQSRAANNDYMQSQYILGQLGRYYQNPPCNPCGCGG